MEMSEKQLRDVETTKDREEQKRRRWSKGGGGIDGGEMAEGERGDGETDKLRRGAEERRNR